MKRCVLLLVGLCAGVSSPLLGEVSVDGNLYDWGISTAKYRTSPNSYHNVYDSAYGYANNQPGTLRSWTDPGAAPVNSSPVTTLSGTSQITSPIYYAIEDSCDTAGLSAPVGPLYGGQKYDAEFLGVSRVDGKLWIALSTGQRPDSGTKYFEPGDLQIVTVSGKVYGLEVGSGGAKGFAGATYTLDASGYAAASTSLSDRPTGSLWLTDGLPSASGTVKVCKSSTTSNVVTLSSGTVPVGFGVGSTLLGATVVSIDLEKKTVTLSSNANQNISWTKTINWTSAHDWLPGLSQAGIDDTLVQLTGGTRVKSGNADYLAEFVFNFSPTILPHAWIETSLDESLLGGPNDPVAYVAWAPSCANDNLMLAVPIPTGGPPVPEPTALVVWSLLGAGWAGLWAMRRRAAGLSLGGSSPKKGWSAGNRRAILALIESGRRRVDD